MDHRNHRFDKYPKSFKKSYRKVARYPMLCTSKQECEEVAKYWMEVEVNLALACEVHYNFIKKKVKVYSEGLLPDNAEGCFKIVDYKLRVITKRLIDRGIKHPEKWRELENEILGQIENISPKRFNKLRKQYAQMGANDADLMLLDDRYRSVNIIENRNGVAHPMCTCGKLATWWFTLRTRKIFRCEEHRTDIESPVYDQGVILKKGIQTSDNDFYQRVDDYIRDGDEEKPHFSFDELLDETKDCDHCTNLDLISHKYFESLW